MGNRVKDGRTLVFTSHSKFQNKDEKQLSLNLKEKVENKYSFRRKNRTRKGYLRVYFQVSGTFGWQGTEILVTDVIETIVG